MPFCAVDHLDTIPLNVGSVQADVEVQVLERWLWILFGFSTTNIYPCVEL